ncbi:MAG: DUF6485 family protein [Clostridiales Family XIII bacterium]|jgi:hypothetical protein|nr:DUF6485 family protein [Clostridiales Family XIII bacterium]
MKMPGSTFCPCTNTSCELNPANHDKGCDLCMEDSIKTKEVPRCLFMHVTDDIDGVDDWSFENFARHIIAKVGAGAP